MNRVNSEVANKVLTISTDFSRYPGPRLKEDGPYSGEEFRDQYLVPALEQAEQSGDRVDIVLDGARGYTASFLEEAFGGLIRRRGFTKDRIYQLLVLHAGERRVAYWRDRIAEYIEKAAREAG